MPLVCYILLCIFPYTKWCPSSTVLLQRWVNHKQVDMSYYSPQERTVASLWVKKKPVINPSLYDIRVKFREYLRKKFDPNDTVLKTLRQCSCVMLTICPGFWFCCKVCQWFQAPIREEWLCFGNCIPGISS